MGNYCKTCEQRINERQQEIIRQNDDNIQPYINKRSYLRSRLSKDNINDFIPEIIFLQRKIKKFLSSKQKSNEEYFYKKNYSGNIETKINEDFDIIGYNEENNDNVRNNNIGKHSSQKSEDKESLNTNSESQYTIKKKYSKSKTKVNITKQNKLILETKPKDKKERGEYRSHSLTKQNATKEIENIL